ncbi:ExeA family protein [Agarivorans sp. Toyoura001]|uniref:ExeA family protein n=1 Tax=unclassified Agarivorans TaxID=2636026 RepID=UPI0010EA4941|nr:AAA family ATPase [Agarivorans sp. Toyoura001]GDY27158.1 ATPase AAA [Agarivorans sp. Toyoura001]
MYLDYFGLKENPFSIAPNPDFLFMSERHKEALAHLTFGLGETGGFVLLTGEVGTGKTTVSRALLKQVPDNTQVALVLNPSLTELELLATVCDELKIDYNHDNFTLKNFGDVIRQRLLENHWNGGNTMLLIDEAQHLSVEVLEQLRLLTNFETDTRKLLRVVLIGQPELQQKLKQPELRQLAQRITARYHLLPLTINEVEAYIRHRLMVAGCQRPLFPTAVVNHVFKAAEGIPRVINLLCDRALLATFARDQMQVDKSALEQAIQETALSEPEKSVNTNYLYVGAVLGCLALALVFLYQQWPRSQPEVAVDNAVVEAPLEPVVAKQEPKVTFADVAPAISSNQDQLQEWQELRKSNTLPGNSWQLLLRAWGYDVVSAQANCKLVPSLDLKCLSLSGGERILRGINLPAVVELEDGGTYFYAVIRHWGPKVELWIGDRSLMVTERWLKRRWNGEFQILWQPPRGYDGILKQGSQGDAVYWLDQSLSLLHGQRPRRTYIFDGELSRQVQRFQQQQSLNADGIAGVFTLLRLNEQIYVDQPRLLELN